MKAFYFKKDCYGSANVCCYSRPAWPADGSDAVGHHVFPHLHLQLRLHALHHGPLAQVPASRHRARASHRRQVSE